VKKILSFILTLIFLFTVGCIDDSPAVSEPIPPSEEDINQQDPDVAPIIDEQPQEPDEEPTGEMAVHFLDVGQGDSILILSENVTILIDGGPRSAGQKVVNYLKKAGVTSIDLVISTHAHEDHIGGLIDVLQEFQVEEVIDPAVIHTSKTFEDYLTLIDQKDIKFTEGRQGQVRDLGAGAKLELLHPVEPSNSHLNDSSIVAKLTFGQVSFFFTGDAEEASEQQILLQSMISLRSTVLKVGHHGSSSSTTQAFLQAVNPEVAVIMCGKDNDYGHPHDETLQKLTAAGIEIYRTDIHGDIVITTDGENYTVNAGKPYIPQPEAEPAPAEGQYIGSIKSDKYHYPTCWHVESIDQENRIWFQSIEEAKEKGYVPYGACKLPM